MDVFIFRDFSNRNLIVPLLFSVKNKLENNYRENWSKSIFVIIQLKVNFNLKYPQGYLKFCLPELVCLCITK